MNELMIINEDNKEVKSYAIYYTINDRFYIIYTNKEKDENNYIVLHIAKVLKEVNNTPEGIVPTGKYIGLEISDQSEWDSAKTNIGEIVSNMQNNTPTSVSYLPVNEINGISIKSSKTFKLREDIVDSIIVESSSSDNSEQYVIPASPIDQPAVEETTVSSEMPETTAEDFNPVAPIEDEQPVLEAIASTPAIGENVDTNIPAVEQNTISNIDLPDAFTQEEESLPAMAPNPFEVQPEVEIPTSEVVEEEKPINPYEVMQQQRADEMISALANDNMQDIVVNPVIPVSELENKIEETSPLEENKQAVEESSTNSKYLVDEAVNAEVPAVEESYSSVEETPIIPEREEVISSESFVDSIVADVSDILDKQEEPSTEEKEDYERLYNDALEKTVELEKELAELHNKLNNIKNIIE